MKPYSIADLFKTSWSDLTSREIAVVFDHNSKMKKAAEEGLQKTRGYHGIMILRELRKNKSAVSKIDEAQAVDCINDLAFLNQPWYQFPTINLPEDSIFKTPETHLKNHSMVQLFWMDSLFSKYLIQEYWDDQAHPPQTPSTIAEVFLDQMISVIYTPSGFFDEKQIDERGLLFNRYLSNYDRSAIFLTYVNLKMFIIDSFPFTFPKPEEQEVEQPVISKPPTDSEPMWQDILFFLSETNAYLGMDRAKNAPMYEALNYMEKKHKESKPKAA